MVEMLGLLVDLLVVYLVAALDMQMAGDWASLLAAYWVCSLAVKMAELMGLMDELLVVCLVAQLGD